MSIPCNCYMQHPPWVDEQEPMTCTCCNGHPYTRVYRDDGSEVETTEEDYLYGDNCEAPRPYDVLRCGNCHGEGVER